MVLDHELGIWQVLPFGRGRTISMPLLPRLDCPKSIKKPAIKLF